MGALGAEHIELAAASSEASAGEMRALVCAHLLMSTRTVLPAHTRAHSQQTQQAATLCVWRARVCVCVCTAAAAGRAHP